MAAGTYDVVLRPFRELIKAGELALAHAAEDPNHENAPFLKAAARSLHNEGERALKKITPLLLNPSPDFSEFLLSLALRQDETSSRFRDIDVLLYDFEDYIQTDTFEKDKFDTLQAAVKDLAIVLLDKIRRHTAEATLDEALPPPPVPLYPLPPVPNTPPVIATSASRRPISRHRIAGPALGPLPPTPGQEQPLRRTSHPVDHQPRSAYSSGTPTTPVSPGPYDRSFSVGDASLPVPPATQQRFRPTSSADSIQSGMSHLDIRAAGIAAAAHGTGNRPLSPVSPQGTHLSMTSSNWSNAQSQYQSSICTSVPEADCLPEDGELSPGMAKTVSNSFILDHERAVPDRMVPATSRIRSSDGYRGVNGDNRASKYVEELPADGKSEATVQVSNLSTDESPAVSRSGSASNRTSIKTEDGASGSGSGSGGGGGRLSLLSGSSFGRKRRRGSGSSFGPDSTFGIVRGFCKGATKFQNDGPGGAVKKVGGGATAPGQPGSQDYTPELLWGQMYSAPAAYTDVMAQCAHCDYKTIYSQLLADMKQDPLATQHAQGLKFRSRFLYKSHISSRDASTTYFACLFCTQTGGTSRAGDATVFQSANLLFRHLKRHQLPLPQVPGVTVLYDDIDAKNPSAEDYDLHFPNASAQIVPYETEEDEIADITMPTARAVRDHIYRRNDKPLAKPPPLGANGSAEEEEILQFLQGARIIRIEFPERGEGKWCRGWHDGVYGVFPSKMVELEVPRALDAGTALQQRSMRSAVTKWKWENKTSPWLKFGKGDRITNIAWDDPRAWYWTGTTSKGKAGIFPKSHIKIESVQDGSQVAAAAAAEGARKTVPSAEKAKFSSFFLRS